MEIPTYGDQKVRKTPLPDVRVSADAPVEAFGGGAAILPITRSIQGLAESAADVISRVRNQAIETMTQEGYTKIVAERNRLLHDPKDGALTKKGKDAFGTPEEYGKKLDDYTAQIENSMPDPQARLAFRKLKDSNKIEFDSVLNNHISREVEKFQDDTFNGLVSTLTDDAIANYDSIPSLVKANLQTMKSAAVIHLFNKGMTGPDAEPVKAALLKNIEDKVHVGIINRLVANENYDAARKYFSQNKAGISGMSMDDLERQIKKSDIFAQKDQYLSAAKLLDKSKGARPENVIPGFDLLSADQRDALKRRYDNKQSPTAHHEFYALSKDQLADMDRAEFEVKYWSRFDNDHKRKAEAYWQAAVEAARGKEDFWKSIRGDHDMVISALRKSGVVAASGELKGRDFETAQRFEDYVDDKFKNFAHENKRNPRDEEKQKIIGKAMLDTVYIDRTFWTDPVKPRGVLTEEEAKNAYLPLESIPRNDRLMLVNLARAQGIIRGTESGGPSDDRAVIMLQERIQKAAAAANSGTATRAQIIAIMKGDQ